MLAGETLIPKHTSVGQGTEASAQCFKVELRNRL